MDEHLLATPSGEQGGIRFKMGVAGCGRRARVSIPALSPKADWRAPAAAACGSICVGTVPALAIGLYGEGLQPASLLFWRYWMALCVLIPLAMWAGPGLAADWRRSGPALVANSILLGAVQTFCYFRAIHTVPSSIVVTIFFSYPIFTLLIDRFVLGQPLVAAKVSAAAVLIAGVVLMSWPRLSAMDSDPVGLMYAVASAVVFSVYLSISQRFTKNAAPFAAATFIYGGLAIAFAGVVAINGLQMPQSPNGWLRMIAIATLGGALQISSFAYALPRLNASGYGVIISLELVTVAIIGVTFLAEPLSAMQAIGLSLVIVAIIVDRMRRRP